MLVRAVLSRARKNPSEIAAEEESNLEQSGRDSQGEPKRISCASAMLYRTLPPRHTLSIGLFFKRLFSSKPAFSSNLTRVSRARRGVVMPSLGDFGVRHVRWDRAYS